MERVDRPARLHRAGGGHEGLARHLPAEDALALLVGRDASEEVDLDGLEVEELHERVDGLLGHGPILAYVVGGTVPAMSSARTFPDGFRWSTATAAHQIEGGNWNNDWWRWEHTPGSGCKESSGDCCDSWNRWPEDVALVAELGLTDYRFSLEWSRIEPEDGEFSAAALDHYARQCEALLEAGIDPVVTFHHFTTPRWLADRGGWEQPETADRFAAYCERAAGHLKDVIRRACTINEPSMVATIGYLAGAFPPGKTDPAARRAVNEVFVDAHRKAVDAIRANAPGVPVGITLAMSDYQAVDGGESKRDRIRAGMEDVFLQATTGDDFVGVQAYSRTRVGPDGTLGPEEGVPTLIMGYEYYPQCLAACIRRAWEVTGGRGADPRHRERHRHDRRRPAAVLRARRARGRPRLHRRRHRRARLHVLEPARQLRVGLRLRPPVRPRRVRPRHVRPHPQGERPLVRAGRPGQRPRRLKR